MDADDVQHNLDMHERHDHQPIDRRFDELEDKIRMLEESIGRIEEDHVRY
jgi:hypothetical protein